MRVREMVCALPGVLEEKKLRLREEILSWAAGNLPRYPWRQPGAIPYTVLVGELWLQRTAPATAVWVYHCFLQQFPSLQDAARAPEEKLNGVLSCFGLGRYAEEMTALADRLLREGRGVLPGDSESLARISGLDRHSIQAIMCFGYGLPVAVVDSNVARMLGRIFGETLPPKLLRESIGAVSQCLLPPRRPQLYNRGLLEVAEMICTVEDPMCPSCPVAGVCDSARVSPLADCIPGSTRLLRLEC